MSRRTLSRNRPSRVACLTPVSRGLSYSRIFVVSEDAGVSQLLECGYTTSFATLSLTTWKTQKLVMRGGTSTSSVLLCSQTRCRLLCPPFCAHPALLSCLIFQQPDLDPSCGGDCRQPCLESTPFAPVGHTGPMQEGKLVAAHKTLGFLAERCSKRQAAVGSGPRRSKALRAYATHGRSMSWARCNRLTIF